MTTPNKKAAQEEKQNSQTLGGYLSIEHTHFGLLGSTHHSGLKEPKAVQCYFGLKMHRM
jgi:hypothetical protein